jgi:hypothetical protein
MKTTRTRRLRRAALLAASAVGIAATIVGAGAGSASASPASGSASPVVRTDDGLVRGTDPPADSDQACLHGGGQRAPVYDAWTQVMRTVDPDFEFTDPALRHSLPMDLAFAAAADQPTALLTGPCALGGRQPGLIRLPRVLVDHEMALVSLEDHPLTATAALVWHADLPRPLQQILFDAADGISPPGRAFGIDGLRPPAG